jgi:mono/diheme cytochrome c family protein
MKTIHAAALCAGLVLCSCAYPAGKDKPGDPESGKAVFEQQCEVCHRADSAEKKIGPGLKGLFKKAKFANGTKVSEETVREQVENGKKYGMPAFRDLLSNEEKSDLLAFLRTL